MTDREDKINKEQLDKMTEEESNQVEFTQNFGFEYQFPLSIFEKLPRNQKCTRHFVTQGTR